MTGSARWGTGRLGTGLLVALAIAAWPAHGAGGETAPWKQHPGYVSGSAFTELADEDGDLVEVSVTSALLGLVASSVRAQDEDLAAMIGALASVSAVVVEVDRDAQARLAATERALAMRLEAGGWDTIARIREGTSRVTVWVLPRDGRLEGLTVLVRDGREVVFTNIAGRIDMEKMQSLAERLDLPGLDRFMSRNEDPGAGDQDDESERR